MAKRAACYCRVSTKKDDQLDSLEKQREFFTRFFCGNPEYELSELYADEGISAKSMRNRRAFQRMLKDAGAGRFDAVFVKDVSRFARNVRDFYHALDALEAAGVKVHFVTMGLRSEEASRFTLGLMALLAEDESERLSVKVKFGKNVTAGRGRVPNFVFGYERIDTYTLAPDPVRADWVRRIFSMYVEEGMGAASIAQRLNEAAVATERGNIGSWTQSAVCKLIKNRLYTGKVINRKSEVVDFRTGRREVYPDDRRVVVEREDFRIVDDALFERAQEVMARRAGSFAKGTRQSGTHALSNLLRCAEDGRCMRRVERNGRVNWACSVRNARGAAACQNASKVEEAGVVRRLERLAIAALKERPRAAEEIERRALEQLSAKGARPRADIRRLTERIRRYRELYADGLLSRAELAQSLAPIQEELGRERERTKACENIASARMLITHMVTLYMQGGKPLADNAFLKRWIEAVEISSDGQETLVLLSGTRCPLD